MLKTLKVKEGRSVIVGGIIIKTGKKGVLKPYKDYIIEVENGKIKIVDWRDKIVFKKELLNKDLKINGKIFVNHKIKVTYKKNRKNRNKKIKVSYFELKANPTILKFINIL